MVSTRIDGLYLSVNEQLFRNIFQPEDLFVTIRDGFESAERQLKDYTQQKRGEKKPRAGGDTDDDSAEGRLRQGNQIPQSY